MAEVPDPVVVSAVGAQLAAAIVAAAAANPENEAIVALAELLGSPGGTITPEAIAEALAEADPGLIPLAAVAGAAPSTIQATAANFTNGSAFPEGQTTLLPGQLGHESDTGRFKFGAGATAWASLPYAGSGAPIVKTAANHVSDNTVLAAGQSGIESDTGKEKLGAGSWNSLAYRTEPYVAPVTLADAATDLAIAHDRKRLRFTHATPVLTIKAQANVAFPADFSVPIGSSANLLTLQAAVGVTINGVSGGAVTVAGEGAGGAFRLQKLADNVWLAHTGGTGSAAALVAQLAALTGGDRLPGSAVQGVTLAPSDKTSALHASDNTLLAAGQRGRETNTGREKVGPGNWNALPYANGDAWGNLAADAATERAAFAGLPTIAGFNADGTKRVVAEIPEALAAPANAIAGGEAKVTGTTLRDLAKVRTIALVGDVIPLELPKLETGKTELSLNWRAEVAANAFLRALALPAALDDAEICGTGSITNTHAANTVQINLKHPVVDGANSASKVLDTAAALQVWEDGSAALRSIGPGQTRFFEYRARRGRVTWRACPLNMMGQVVGLFQARRQDLVSYNLPTITDGWYSIILVTITNLDSAAAPAACDGVGVEQIETHIVAANAGCATRIEGILTQGGNVIFDTLGTTGQGRAMLVRRHNFKPVSVASLRYAATFRDKPTGGSAPVNWAGAAIPGGEECYIFTGAIARGGANLGHPPRSGLGITAFLPQPIASALVVGLTAAPVTAWAEETTNADLNSEGTSFSIPLIVRA